MRRVNRVACVMAAMLMAISASAFAESYEMSLTRKGSNIYRVNGKQIIVQTRHCYVYAYSEDAILNSSGYGGEVNFLDSKDKCDVKAVFGASTQKPGKYAVTVTREDDDWFEVFGSNSYIKTEGCLSLALGEDAILTVLAGNVGRLRFKDGNDCLVEAIYSKLRL